MDLDLCLLPGGSHKTKAPQRHQGPSPGFQGTRVRSSSPSCLTRLCSQANFLCYCQQPLVLSRLGKHRSKLGASVSCNLLGSLVLRCPACKPG